MYGTDGRIGANARDVSQSFHTARACEAGHAPRGLDMHGIESHAAAHYVKADGIDGTISAEERCSDRSLVMDISSRGLRPRI